MLRLLVLSFTLINLQNLIQLTSINDWFTNLLFMNFAMTKPCKFISVFQFTNNIFTMMKNKEPPNCLMLSEAIWQDKEDCHTNFHSNIFQPSTSTPSTKSSTSSALAQPSTKKSKYKTPINENEAVIQLPSNDDTDDPMKPTSTQPSLSSIKP
jgi:hypothetical protein